jgi:hypothetical protein
MLIPGKKLEALLVEPSKHKALNSNPSITKKMMVIMRKIFIANIENLSSYRM